MKCEDKKYFGVEKKTYLKNLHDDTHTHTHTHLGWPVELFQLSFVPAVSGGSANLRISRLAKSYSAN